MLQLQIHDSEVAERIPNNGMHSEAVRFEAGGVGRSASTFACGDLGWRDQTSTTTSTGSGSSRTPAGAPRQR